MCIFVYFAAALLQKSKLGLPPIRIILIKAHHMMFSHVFCHVIIKYNIINISLSDQLRSINFDYGILNMILVRVSLYLYLNELGTCVVLSMGINTRFRVERKRELNMR